MKSSFAPLTQVLGPSDSQVDESEALSPLRLPCGHVLENRFVKVAMYEHGADFFGGAPNDYHHRIYSKWSRGNWGMIITGNIQVCPDHLTLGRDMVFPQEVTPETIRPFQTLAAAIRGSSERSDTGRPLAIAQISHAGRQSTNIVGGRTPFAAPLAPSKTRVGENAKGLLNQVAYGLMFQESREMTPKDIEDVIERFVQGVRVCVESGFDGVEFHCSHGYLLSQFMSPKTNRRIDEYGEPLTVLRKILQRVKSFIPKGFVLGVKLNAADYVTSGLSEKVALDNVKELATIGVDFIEVSGGDYENPEFARISTPGSRQAFFEVFAASALSAISQLPDGVTKPAVMLTGGLRTRGQFASALKQKHAQLLGIGRLSILEPLLPITLQNDREGTYLSSPLLDLSPHLSSWTWLPSVVGAGFGTMWYTVGMRYMIEGQKPPALSMLALFWKMYISSPPK